MFPGMTIPATAEEIGADLIVMGTRGLTGLKHVLLGSVAERTIRVAACPVLTVKVAEQD
jgi:nucleotide-binding universal stress UspA family protein